MAFMHKIIKRHKGIEYVWSQNRPNSRYSLILAYERKTKEDLGMVAEIDNHTNAITFADDVLAVPNEAKEAIRRYITEA